MNTDSKATAYTLAEEYDVYHEETEAFVTRQIGLAVFISVMAISSIAAVFTTNTLLKGKQYGILLANGYTQSDITVGIATEIGIIVFFSAILSWAAKLVEFERSVDPFRIVIIALSQPAPKYWGRSRRQLPIHSALLTYRDNHVSYCATGGPYSLYAADLHFAYHCLNRNCNIASVNQSVQIPTL